METKPPRRILLEQEVKLYAPLGRTTRWRMESQGAFPKRIRLSSGRIGYYEDEIRAWQEALPRGNESAKAMPVSPGHAGRHGGAADE